MRTTEQLEAAGAGLDPALFAGGAGSDPWLVRLAGDPGRAVGLDLADAIHWLHQLHGGATGLIDGASLRARSPDERAFLLRAFDAWQCERRALSALVVAVGPIPSTPGQLADEATLVTLAAAITTLGSSDRAGVSLGAATALAVEWHGLRGLIDRAADRFAATIPACDLADRAELLASVAGFVDAPGVERAVRFGAAQLLHQHDAFVVMLQRRSSARATA